jgi:hypothetical protein
MKSFKMVLAVTFVMASACGHSQNNASSTNSVDPSPSAAADVTTVTDSSSLPGKPGAIGFIISDKDGASLNIVAKVAPGSPQLPIIYWKAADASDKQTLILRRMIDCVSSSSGYSCEYTSDDGNQSVVIRYSTAVQSFKATHVDWNSVSVDDADIYPMPNSTAGKVDCDFGSGICW